MVQKPRAPVALTAAALQDHLMRVTRVEGARKPLPSFTPGAKLTLAQHLGLVPRPPALLTARQWDAVHEASRRRDGSGAAAGAACCICLQEFREAPQVLLSCSHVLHTTCLASFERHTRTKCCPLCRAEGYQVLPIADAAEAYRHRCAMGIQAAVRAWLARRRAWQLRRHQPPADARLKREWGAARLQELHRDLDLDLGPELDLDQLLAEADQCLEASRQASAGLAARLAGVQLPRQPVAGDAGGCPAAAGGTDVAPAAAAASSASKPACQRAGGSATTSRRGALQPRAAGSLMRGQLHARAPPGWAAQQPLSSTRRQATHVAHLVARARERRGALASAVGGGEEGPAGSAFRGGWLEAGGEQAGKAAGRLPVDWDGVLARACSRDETDCAICLGSLVRQQGGRGGQGALGAAGPGAGRTASPAHRRRGDQQRQQPHQQGLAVLSCSHVLHASCVVAFERFAAAQGGGVATCPVCRAGYERRCFAAGGEVGS